MNTLNDIDKLKRYIESAVRSKVGKGVLTNVTANYIGGRYDPDRNILSFGITYDIKEINEGGLKEQNTTERYHVTFREDYSKVEFSKWDRLLHSIKFSGTNNGTNYMFNEYDNYYNILLNLYLLFHTKNGKIIPEDLRAMKDSVISVKGLTVKTEVGANTYIPELSDKKNGDLFVLKIMGKDNYSIKHYINGRTLEMYRIGNRVGTQLGEYKRLPNGTTTARHVVNERVREDKYVFDGMDKPRGAYHRAINSIKLSVIPFSIEDDDIYLNSHQSMFRVEINEDKGTIGFYHLTTDREGTKAGGDYYLSTLFNGEFRGLQMWGDVPEWFLDSHVLSDIYADHIEGKYGTDGKIGNL